MCGMNVELIVENDFQEFGFFNKRGESSIEMSAAKSAEMHTHTHCFAA